MEIDFQCLTSAYARQSPGVQTDFQNRWTKLGLGLEWENFRRKGDFWDIYYGLILVIGDGLSMGGSISSVIGIHLWYY